MVWFTLGGDSVDERFNKSFAECSIRISQDYTVINFSSQDLFEEIFISMFGIGLLFEMKVIH